MIMKEESLTLTRTSTTANYTNEADPAKVFNISGGFNFDREGHATEIHSGSVIEPSIGTVASFRRDAGNSGLSITFYTTDPAKMQQVMNAINEFVAVAIEKGGDV